MEEPESRITQILRQVAGSRNEATQLLLPLVYDQLRRLAAGKLAGEAQGHTLQPTALVHEAYLKLLSSIDDSWKNRSHFFGAAAEAMRRILIDHARSRNRIKRGGGSKPVSLDNMDVLEQLPPQKSDELIQLDAALNKLATLDPKKAELVKIRFFAGLTMPQAAEALGISLRTAERHWSFARVWLQEEISRSPDDASDFPDNQGIS